MALMILKKGDTSKEVKVLQQFLNTTKFPVAISGPGSTGKETEFFGPATELAVKRWQVDNGLKDDGIVGPITWSAMGLATTDVSEDQPKPSNGFLEIKKKFLRSGEFIAGPTKKQWVFLHHTAGWDNPYNVIDGWERDKNGPMATEFVLGGPKINDGTVRWDGELVQAFPTGGYAWHLGTGNNVMHRNSVGIEVCNFGFLTLGGFWRWNSTTKRNEWIVRHPSKYYTYVGTEVEPASSQLVTLSKPFRKYTTWHKYSDTQLSVLKDCLHFIANRDNIDVRKGLPELIKQKGVDAFDIMNVSMCEKTPGLWNHTNVRSDKVDMFPQEELIDMLLSL